MARVRVSCFLFYFQYVSCIHLFNRAPGRLQTRFAGVNLAVTAPQENGVFLLVLGSEATKKTVTFPPKKKNNTPTPMGLPCLAFVFSRLIAGPGC